MSHKWTDDEREIVRRDYKHTHNSRREIAVRLGVTEFGVAGQIAFMGIAKSDDRRPWSEKEEECLVELMPQYCPRRVAIMMHRSLNSVVVKLKRLQLSRRTRDGWFTKAEVCEILAVDHKWVQRRIDRGELVATYHFEHRPGKIGGSAWHIEAKDLRAFIRRFPSELTGRNIDIIMVVELLAGITSGGV